MPSSLFLTMRKWSQKWLLLPILGAVLLPVSCGKNSSPAENSTTPEPAAKAEPSVPTATQPAPLKRRPLSFPRDEAAHYEQPFEWWRFNVQFTDEKGQIHEFFFCALTTGRHFLLLNDKSRNVVQTKDYYESLQASQDILSVQSPSLNWKQDGAVFQHRFNYSYEGITADFRLSAKRKPFLLNSDGFIQMGGSGAAFYYSISDMEVTGMLDTGSGPAKVTGSGWYNHQWGQWDWVEDFSHWKWFAVKLDNGVDLMLFNLYKDKRLIHSYCGYIEANGTQVHQLNADLVTTDYFEDENGGKWARHVQIHLPSLPNTTLTLAFNGELAFVEPQVLCEGTMTVTGTFNGQPVKGTAFGELNRGE